MFKEKVDMLLSSYFSNITFFTIKKIEMKLFILFLHTQNTTKFIKDWLSSFSVQVFSLYALKM